MAKRRCSGNLLSLRPWGRPRPSRRCLGSWWTDGGTEVTVTLAHAGPPVPRRTCPPLTLLTVIKPPPCSGGRRGCPFRGATCPRPGRLCRVTHFLPGRGLPQASPESPLTRSFHLAPPPLGGVCCRNGRRVSLAELRVDPVLAELAPSPWPGSPSCWCPTGGGFPKRCRPAHETAPAFSSSPAPSALCTPGTLRPTPLNRMHRVLALRGEGGRQT